MTLFTIGFTKKTAEQFFTILQDAGVQRVVDVRLNNTGQLAGFTKRDDLSFFLRAIGSITYLSLPLLAPTPDLLSAYRDRSSTWEEYAQAFSALLHERRVEDTLRGELRDKDCFLCSEPTADHCHRRIVAEYLQQRWSDVHVRHV